MNTERIILQLQKKLPTLSPYFSDRIHPSTVTILSQVVTIQTENPHGLTEGSLVSISGIPSSNPVASFVESETEVELTLSTDHDYTLNPGAVLDLEQEVRIYDQDLAEYRTYRLKRVPNRRKLILYRDDFGPLDEDNAYFVDEIFSGYGYNGLKTILSVPAPTIFTYSAGMDLNVPVGLVADIGFICTNPRISGAINIETILDSYTEQPLDNVWAFVVLGDFAGNKDRRNQNDAISTQGRQSSFYQKIVGGFSVYIIVPNKGEVLTKTNGRAARDLVELIRRPLFQSLLGVNLTADLGCPGQGVITYAGDGFFQYNGAFYVHEFNFQQVIDITEEDTAIQDFERAFRDIAVAHRNQFDDLAVYESAINLDEEP